MEPVTLSTHDATELAAHFRAVSSRIPLREIRNEAEYDAAVLALNALLDAGGADETHALAELASLLGRFIGDYDDRHHRSLTAQSAA